MRSPGQRYFVVTTPPGFDGYTSRHFHYCKTRNQANDLRNRIKRWKAEQKAPVETLSFDDEAKRWLAYAQAHLGRLDLLPEVISHWERTAKAITQPMNVEALARAYVVWRETQKLGKGTLAEDRYVARRLIDSVGSYPAHEVTTKEIRSFLDGATSESIARKIFKVASLMFDYAKVQGVVVLNPFTELKRPEVSYAIPGILKPAEFKTLLTGAENKIRDLVPFLALAGFVGVRREEMLKEYADDQVLQWEDIDWTKKLITIRDGVAKQTRRKLGNRRFVPMEAALIHWLSPYRKDSGPILSVVDSAFRRRMAKLREETKLDPPRNALRHSYASYWLARSSKEGVGELAKRMGNSEGVARRHYLEVLTRKEGTAWFTLRRAKTGASSQNVVAFPKVA